MKRLAILAISLFATLFAISNAAALSTYLTVQGGTGTSSPSGILYGDNGSTSHLNTVTIGSNLTFSGGTLSATGGGGGGSTFATTSISAIYPLNWNTSTAAMSSATSSASSAGVLSAADWTTFNNKLTNPMTTLGDIIYGDVSGTATRLAGNTLTTPLYLSQTGDGTNSAAPSWQAIPIAGSKAYYAYGTLATSSAAYFNMNPTATSTSASTSYLLANGTNSVQNWISPIGNPGITIIPGGSYIVDLFAARTVGSAPITLQVQIWEVDSSGVDISLIGTTNVSAAIAAAKTQYNLAFTTGAHTMASTASRIVMRVQAITTGTPTLTLYYGDGDQMDLVIPGATVDTSNFVPYTGATKNVDLGAFNASTTGFTVSGTQWIPPLGTPAGTFLAADPNGKIIATTTPINTGGSTEGVQWATAAVLSGTPTYNNGSSGVGATLTEVGSGALSVDGNSPAASDRVLVKNQASAFQDGIYVVTATGSGIASYILTRSTDYNTVTEITPGLTTYVVSGTANTDTTWAVSYTAPLTIGTTNLTYTEVSGGGAAVTSVSNSDGTLTISPTTGAVVASLALAHANTWTGVQTFDSPILVTPALGTPASGNFSTGTFTWPTFNQNTSGTAAGLSATLPIASGGTNETSFGTSNGLIAYNGTGLVNFANYTLTSSLLTATNASTTALSVNGNEISGQRYLAFKLATSTTWTATSTFGIYADAFQINNMPFTGSISSLSCGTDAGTLEVEGSDGSSHVYLSASTTANYNTFSLAFSKGDTVTFTAGNPATSPSLANCNAIATGY